MADDMTAPSSSATAAVTEAPTAAVSAAPAIEAPAQPQEFTATQQPPGPIPFDRHKSILDGAYGERDAARQELERLSWARQIDPAQFSQLQQWATAYREDPVKWLSSTVQELRQAYPHLTPALTSEAARILGASRNFQPEPDIEPDIPVLDGNGQVVSQAFSADRVRQLIQRVVQDTIGKEVSPLKQTLQKQQATADADHQYAQAVATADKQYAQALTYPMFEAHKAAIAKAFEAHEEWDLKDAYLHVLTTEILPTLDQTSQTKLLTKLQTQAAGGTVRPDGSGQGRPDFKGDFRKALEYYEAHPKEAADMEQR